MKHEELGQIVVATGFEMESEGGEVRGEEEQGGR